MFNKKICFLDEPIDIWNTIKDSQETILEKFYRDQTKYAFSFQMMAYISRLSLLKKALKKNYDIIITERSVYTDLNIFAKMLYDSKKIEEINYQIYLKWFHEFIEELPDIKYIYIKALPTVSYNRVIKRQRKGENIPLEYLQKCHMYHEKWLQTSLNKTCIIDTNHNIEDKPEILKKWLDRIAKFIKI